MRSVSYRHAAIGFVFTSLWFVLGFILLWSPLPRALGIHSMMLGAWVLLFFGMIAIDGVLMTLASINGLFPPAGRRRTRTPVPQPTPQQPQHAGGRRPRPQQGG